LNAGESELTTMRHAKVIAALSSYSRREAAWPQLCTATTLRDIVVLLGGVKGNNNNNHNNGNNNAHASHLASLSTQHRRTLRVLAAELIANVTNGVPQAALTREAGSSLPIFHCYVVLQKFHNTE
jgi:hypothetical protein